MSVTITKKSNYRTFQLLDIVSKHDIGMYVLIPISMLLLNDIHVLDSTTIHDKMILKQFS